MKILLTNDDGIDAHGLAVLAEAAKPLGELFWIAPSGVQSGCSHQVTTHAKMRLNNHGHDRWAIHGFPADCVRTAIRHFNLKPDWILSGVNHGGNLGVDTFLSGTVAAVREGAIYGIPGIAFSHYRAKDREFDWERIGHWLPKVAANLMKEPHQTGQFWNVNFPHLKTSDPDPEMVMCECDMTPMAYEWKSEGSDLSYLSHYHERPRTPGGDVEACFGGRIAITRHSILGTR